MGEIGRKRRELQAQCLQYELETPFNDLKKNIGQKVKKASNSRFKSGLKTNTVSNVIRVQRNGESYPGYSFEEDGSVVCVGLCYTVNLETNE